MLDIPTSGTKVCSSCHQEKHVLAFPVRKASSDRLNPCCRDCASEQNKRRYRLKHEIGKRKQNRARMATNPYAQE